MSRWSEVLRTVAACMGGAGLLLLALQGLRSVPDASAARTPESLVASYDQPPSIPAPTSPEMAALRSFGVERIEQLATSGSFERRDSDELREIFEALDKGGKMTLVVAFGREFTNKRIRVDDPSLFPF